MVKKEYIKNIKKSHNFVIRFWYTLKNLDPITNMLVVIY